MADDATDFLGWPCARCHPDNEGVRELGMTASAGNVSEAPPNVWVPTVDANERLSFFLREIRTINNATLIKPGLGQRP
jgi:hypothetical protein